MKSKEWIGRANEVLPEGGFGNFNPSIIINRGKGSQVWDVNNNQYVDYLIGSGPMILGHGNEEVLEAVNEQLKNGFTFFANNPLGIQLAEEIINSVKSAEKVRFVSTGGEADMYAIRLARAYTGRDKILKFEGGYHGMSDEAQMSLAPSELQDFPKPVADSAGILKAVEKTVLIAPYNDIEYTRALISENKEELAAVIVEAFSENYTSCFGFP